MKPKNNLQRNQYTVRYSDRLVTYIRVGNAITILKSILIDKADSDYNVEYL